MPIEPLQVLIVDDSRIFRGVLESALASRPDVRVVGSVWSGEKAIEFVRRTPPDLVTLDVNMPGCGGLEALSSIQQINAERPDRPPVGVILVSAITKKGAAVTVEGLQRGAFDFIPKPEGPSEEENAATIKRELFEKIDLFLDKRLRRFQPSTLSIPRVGPVVSGGTSKYQAIVIGSSTGGPEALTRILPTLCTKTSVPIFIVQHFPAGMTKYFAVGLSKICSHAVTEATDGGVVQERTIYIAPGGRHLLVRRQQQQVITMLNDQPPENHCRPSVDVLFRSAAVAYDGNVIAVILTGMGNDGAAGLGALKRSKAHIIAQDQATSLVWGMPGAAVATNYVDEILPLDQIAAAIGTRMGAR